MSFLSLSLSNKSGFESTNTEFKKSYNILTLVLDSSALWQGVSGP